MPDQKSSTPRPPAPGTATTVHLLIGRPPGRVPLVAADLHQVAGEPLLYLRLEVDDRERQYTRHKVDVTFSGPPADIHALLAQVTAAVEQAGRPEEG